METKERFAGIYTEKERQAKIKAEHARLCENMRGLDDRRKNTLAKLFWDAAFMAVTLEETRQIIIRDGVIEQYQNGENQWGIKKSAAVEVYDKMVNTYCKLIDQINKHLPECNTIDKATEVLNRINGGL